MYFVYRFASLAAVVQNATSTRTVLLLSDSQTDKVRNLVQSLQLNGLNVTYIEKGVLTYSGVPSATNFDVVLLITGDQYEQDMPTNGQQAIVNA